MKKLESEKKTLSTKDIIMLIRDYFCQSGYKEIKSEGLLTDETPKTFAPGIVYSPIRDAMKSDKQIKTNKYVFGLHRISRYVDWDRVGYGDFLSFFQVAAAIDILNSVQFSIKRYIDRMAYLLFDLMEIDKNQCFVSVFGGRQICNLTLEADVKSKKIWEDYGLKSKFIKGYKNFHLVNLDLNPAGFHHHIYFKNGNLTKIASITFDYYKFSQKKDSLIPLSTPIIWSKIYIEKIAKIIQKKRSIWEVDLFKSPIDLIENRLSNIYLEISRYKIYLVVDYLRTICFLVYDGQKLDSTPRGRKLKRILSKFVDASLSLGICRIDFFSSLIGEIIYTHRSIYPDLGKVKGKVLEIVLKNMV